MINAIKWLKSKQTANPASVACNPLRLDKTKSDSIKLSQNLALKVDRSVFDASFNSSDTLPLQNQSSVPINPESEIEELSPKRET